VTSAPDDPADPERGPSAGTSAVGTADAAETTGAAQVPSARQLPVWQEMILLLGIALLLAIATKAFLVQAFYIPSASMNDTLVTDDRILVQKVSYWGGGDPDRGDIVVFADPGGWLGAVGSQAPGNPLARALETVGLYPTGGHLVKRVIGVGGDRVRCCDDRDRLTVNGVPLDERSYLGAGEKPSTIDFDVTVRKGYVWVQGDNRSNSADSRVHLGDPGGGQVPTGDLVGKVFAVVWPFDHAKTLSKPATFRSVR
jgi:signal peptidase I